MDGKRGERTGGKGEAEGETRGRKVQDRNPRIRRRGGKEGKRTRRHAKKAVWWAGPSRTVKEKWGERQGKWNKKPRFRIQV